MIDDIIAYSYDEEGNKHEMSLGEVYEQCGQMIKIMYFDGMIRGNGMSASAHYLPTKKMILECLEIMLDRIHNKYADHIESAREQALGLKNASEGPLND